MRRRNPLYSVLSLANRVIAQAYIAVVRGSFASWGRGCRIGRGARLISPHLVVVGDRVNIGEQAWLNAQDDRSDGAPTLRIGAGSYIGRFVQINAWRSVTIGQDVMISDRVFISDADHRYQDPETAIGRQGDYFSAPVLLEDGCWIGIGAVILPGVTIGRNAIVSANSVVTRSIPDRSVAGGVPAQVIIQR